MTAAHDRAFLADILAHPDDDAPRLIYADWLTDHGNPERGEIIRVQIERARLDEDDPAQDELERREKQLLNRHPEWLADLPKWARVGTVFRRGFPEAVHGAAGQVRSDLDRILGQVPVRDVTIEFSPGRLLQTLAPSERLAGLRRLCLSGPTRGEYAPFPEGFWEAFGGLEELSLQVGQLYPPDAEALLASSLPRRLRRLHLNSTLRHPEVYRLILSRRDLFAPLEMLELYNHHFDLAELAGLAAVPMVELRSFCLRWSRPIPASFLTEFLSGESHPRLSSLAVTTSCEMDEERAAALAAAPGLARLHKLNLEGNYLTAGTVRNLIERTRFTSLRHLDLGYNPISVAGMRMLAACPRLATLTRLSLPAVHAKPEGVVAVVRSRHLRNLRRLDLTGNALEDAGVKALVEGNTLPPLAELGLQGNHLTDAGVRTLIESEMEMPVRLNLSFNRIGPAGAALLAGSPRSRCLGELSLDGNQLGDKGYRALADSPYLGGLWRLQVGGRGKQAHPRGIARLRERFGAALVD
jgi:uncharacterized protein (TIGR02996 family)